MKKGIIVVLIAFSLNLLIYSCALTEEKNDRMKVTALSFLVPGLGQYYMGSNGYAKLFIAIEFAFWADYYYNYKMMNYSKEDYIAQAALHAGVNPSKYGTGYLNAIGSYDNSFEYNQDQLQYYTSATLYSGDKIWAWDDVSSRTRFLKLREDELDYENKTKFCIAGIIANHFISALHASKSYNKRSKNISFLSVNSLNDGMIARYTRSF